MGNCLKAVSSSSDDISLLRENVTIPRELSSSSEQLGSPPTYQETINQPQNIPVFYPSPNVSRSAAQLTEEEQIKIAKRMGLIQHLPTGVYDESKKNRECAICMGDFVIGDPIRFLPCMHTYHTICIDDWLMRSFTCPSCMEPVDAALLSTYQTD